MLRNHLLITPFILFLAAGSLTAAPAPIFLAKTAAIAIVKDDDYSFAQKLTLYKGRGASASAQEREQAVQLIMKDIKEMARGKSKEIRTKIAERFKQGAAALLNCAQLPAELDDWVNQGS